MTLTRLTETLLWDKRLSRRASYVWALLLVAAPLALAAAIWLQVRIAGQLVVRVDLDRERALVMAREVAERQGLDVTGWNEFVKTDSEMDAYRYLVGQGERGRQILRDFGVWSVIQVRLHEPDSERRIEVSLTPAGKVLGYRMRPGDQMLPATTSPAAAGAQADALMQERRRLHPELQFAGRTMGTAATGAVTFQWKASVAGIPGLQGEATVRIHGDRVLEDSFRLMIEDPDSLDLRRGRSVHLGFHSAYLAALFFYLMVRYIRRRVQREVSRQRMLLVAFLIGSFFFCVVTLTDEVAIRTELEIPIPYWGLLLIAGCLCLLAGLLVGLSYAAAEGDLRESEPRLLVGLDALLSGRLASRNVGRSIVVGSALLAWTLLARNAIYLAARSPWAGLDTLNGSYDYLFARTPTVLLLVSSLATAIYMVLAGIAGPASLLRRRIRRPWRFLAALAPLTLFCWTFITQEPLGWAWVAASGAVQVVGALVAFFAVDLLAALVMTTGFVYQVSFLGLGGSEGWSLATAGVTLLVATATALRGRVVRAEEVRPAYARDIQERLSLESEVDAAREAQQRLLPAAPPAMTGLSVAASCHAAEKVSGDFYDFFPVSADKLGIFLSDGGGNGLATALTIALTKGYLMHKVHSGLPPAGILRALLDELGDSLHGVNAEGFCYALLDTATGTVDYARFGDTPALLLAGSPLSFPERLDASGPRPLWSGTVRLEAGRRLILYTNGLSRLIGEPDSPSTNRWLLKRLGGHLHRTATELHDSMVKTVFSRRAGLRPRTVRDDVTLLVIALDRQAAASGERVA